MVMMVPSVWSTAHKELEKIINQRPLVVFMICYKKPVAARVWPNGQRQDSDLWCPTWVTFYKDDISPVFLWSLIMLWLRQGVFGGSLISIIIKVGIFGKFLSHAACHVAITIPRSRTNIFVFLHSLRKRLKLRFFLIWIILFHFCQ
jgi:hypothetical protein